MGHFAIAALVLAALPLSWVPAPASAQTSPTKFTTGYRWDALRRLVGRIDAPIDPSSPSTGPYLTSRFTYDDDGQLIRIEKGKLSAWQDESVQPKDWIGFTALETVTVSYDAVGNKMDERLSSVAGGGAVQTVTQTAYDSDDRPICVAVRMNATAFPAADADACALGTTGSDGPDRITRTFYDAASQVLQTRKAVGVVGTEQAYGTYSYTANGKRRYVIDGAGNRARLDYDGHDRRSAWVFPSKTGPTAFDPATPATALATAGSEDVADYEQYQYDANGNRVWFRRRDATTIAYSYDALSRMALKSGAAIPQVSYGYDLAGRQVSAVFASGAGVTNSYDKADRLATSQNTTGGVSRLLQYQYDANGNRTRVTHPDSTWFGYAYDGLDRLGVIEEGAAVGLVSLAYDDLGRRSMLSLGGGVVATSYGYDAASRLASLVQDYAGSTHDVTTALTWTPGSQIRSRSRDNESYTFVDFYDGEQSYVANGLNQYTSITGPNGRSRKYDANGSVTDNGWTNYAYDGENRLVSASGSKRATLSYDPMGRLHEIAVPGAATQLLYDGDALVAEYDGSGSLLRRYVHGPGVDEPLVWYEGSSIASNVRRYLTANHQGSVTSVTDASGDVLSVNTYDDWGVPGAENVGRFQYTGQLWLPELGLYHYKARFYSSASARFLQIDPVGYADQINLYAYVGNDPLSRTDPTGMQYCPPYCPPAPTASKAGAVLATIAATPVVLAAVVVNTLLTSPTQENESEIVRTGREKFEENRRNNVNVDTNTLIYTLDTPDSKLGAAAAAAIRGRTMVVSPQAEQEYIRGTRRVGGTPSRATATARLGALYASGRAVRGVQANGANVRELMSRGIKAGDAAVLASGRTQGLTTVSNDTRNVAKAPELIEPY
jgi:RHS repeat-associated protein